MQDTNNIQALHAALKNYHGAMAEIARNLGKTKQQVYGVLSGKDSPNQTILAEAINVLARRKAEEAKLNEQIETLTDEH